MIRTQHVGLDFKRLSIPEKIVFGNNVNKQMGANVATFATPDIPLATMTTKNQTLSDTAQAAELGDRQKVSVMHKAEKDWDTSFGKQAKYVDRIANGVEDTILLAGFNATVSETVPATAPETLTVKKIAANPLAGSIHVELDVASKATGFVYMMSSTNVPPTFADEQFNITSNTQLVAFLIETHRKVDFYNLPSRATVYLTVVGFNSAGFGIPSAPIAINTL